MRKEERTMRIAVKENKSDGHNFFVIRFENPEEWKDYKSFFETLINTTKNDVYCNGNQESFLKDKEFFTKSLQILDNCHHNDKYDKDNEVSVIVSTREMNTICLALFDLVLSLQYIMNDVKENVLNVRETYLTREEHLLANLKSVVNISKSSSNGETDER